MKRPWVVLIAVAAMAGAALVIARRTPVGSPSEPLEAAPVAVVGLSLSIEDGKLSPAQTTAPLGSLLVLTVLNASARSHVFALAGYDHALPACTLLAGESRIDTLLLSLPGDDFAWLLDGEPAARLDVAGSHLVEGHR